MPTQLRLVFSDWCRDAAGCFDSNEPCVKVGCYCTLWLHGLALCQLQSRARVPSCPQVLMLRFYTHVSTPYIMFIQTNGFGSFARGYTVLRYIACVLSPMASHVSDRLPISSAKWYTRPKSEHQANCGLHCAFFIPCDGYILCAVRFGRPGRTREHQ
jgi:hypothetical protein